MKSIREVEDFSIATRELLDKHGLATVEEVANWRPPIELHPLIYDNIQACLEDFGIEWPRLDA